MGRFPVLVGRLNPLAFFRPALAPVGTPEGILHRQLLLVPRLHRSQCPRVVEKRSQFLVEERTKLKRNALRV